MTDAEMIASLVRMWEISREEAQEVLAAINRYKFRVACGKFPTKGKTCA